ncbi:MAG: hypothetical protein ACXAD7_14555 [Candidatus Kariarchaeaceae archaeon]|jgi:hypothetical protein
MKLIAYFVSLLAAAVGLFLALVVEDEIGVDKVGGLTPLQINGLIAGLIWFLVCLIVFLIVKKLDESRFGLLSLNFLLTWVFVNAGIILGFLIYILVDTGELDVEFDAIKDIFFVNLAISLGPTASVPLGLQER